MADRQLNYRISVDSSAGTAGIRDFSRTVTSELRKADRSLDDTTTAAQRVAQTLGGLADQADTELRQAAAAADALATAMGPDMAAKLGRNGIAQAVGDLNRMGLSFEEIEADADQLVASLRRIDDVQTAAVDQGLGNLGGKLNEVEGATRGANSALANMIGNSTQSLAGLGGVVGDIGVALGQMGEYAADAALDGAGLGASLRSMAGVAGPIGGLAVAMKLVSETMDARARSAATEAAQMERLEDAYTAAGDAAEAYADALRDAGEVMVTLDRNASAAEAGGFLGAISKWGRTTVFAPLIDGLSGAAEQVGLFGKATADIAPLLAQAGASVEQWTAAVMGGNQGYGDFAAALANTTLSVEDQRKILDGLTDAQRDNTAAKRNAAAFEGVFGDAVDDTTDALTDAEIAEKRRQRALEAGEAATQRAIDQAEAEADAREAAAQAAQDQADALNEQVDAAMRTADSQLAATDAFVRFGEVLADNKSSADDVRDAAVNLAKANAQLAENQATAAGRIQTATQRLDGQNASLLSTARTAKGAARDAILGYIAVLNGIPPEVLTELLPDLDEISLEEAIARLNGASATRTATIEADAQTDQAKRDLDALTAPQSMDVFVRYKRASSEPGRTSPGLPIPTAAPVPAGRRLGAGDDEPVAAAAASPVGTLPPLVIDVPVATGPTSLTLDMRGAIMGSRADIVRTVRAATRDGIRLAGRRGMSP